MTMTRGSSPPTALSPSLSHSHSHAPSTPHPTSLNQTPLLTLHLNETTEENEDETVWSVLERLNHERAVHFIPAIVWVLVLMVVGVVGNTLVIYVYRRRFKRTSSNYFILTMAIFDLVACLVGMPTEVYDLFKPYTFYSEFGCKLFRSTENFTVYGSVVVLVEIAFDRYFKICRPLMVVSLFKIKVLCAVAVFSALLMAVPSSILFGINRIDTTIAGVRGYDCSIADAYRHTVFPKAYFIGLAVVFVVTLVILTAIYIRIWLELRKRRCMVIGSRLGRTTRGGAGVGSSGGGGAKAAAGSGDAGTGAGSGEQSPLNEGIPLKKFRVRYLPSMSEDEVMAVTPPRNSSMTQLNALTTATPTLTTTNTPTTTVTKTPSSASPSPTTSKRWRLTSFAQHAASNLHVSRTTIVLFAVTVAFVLSFLPALAVMVVRTVVKDFEKTQSLGSLAATKVFSKFNFINNAINPIIYSFLNVHFRRQASKAVEKVLCCLGFRRGYCCCCCRRRGRCCRRRAAGGGGRDCRDLMPQKSGSDRSTKKEFINL